MDSSDADKKEINEARPPTLDDLLSLCKQLNEEGVEYIVIGGLAIIAQGLTRATEDIDLFLKDSLDNHKKLLNVLNRLPDGASKELKPEDISEFEVIRVVDVFVVDLMTKACGEQYSGNENLIEAKFFNGIKIPFASAELLLKLKQGIREKDVIDRQFLEAKLKHK